MTSLLGCFKNISNLLAEIKDLILLVGIVVCLIIILKQPALRKPMFYLTCVILVVSGILGAIGIRNELKKSSYVNGQITIKNTFDLEDHFNWGTNSITFYHDDYDTTDTYSYTTELTKVSKFDGDYNNYEVYFNDYPIINATITSGAVNFNTPMSIKLPDGSIATTANLNITLQFLTDKTKLTVTTHGAQEAAYLEKYFNDCGFKIVITPTTPTN